MAGNWTGLMANNSDTNCSFDYTGLSSSTNYMYAIAIPINVLTLFGNGLILHIHRRVAKARAAAYYPIILLAAGDMCTGIAGPVTLVLYYVRKHIGDMHYIQIANYVSFIFAFMSANLALFALTYDRLVGTFWPLKHRVAMTRRRYVVMNTCVWTPSIIIGVITPFAWHNKFDPTVCYADWDMLALMKVDYFKYILCPLMILVIVVVLIMYTVILCKVKSHLHARSGLLAWSPEAERPAPSGSVHRMTKSEKRLLVTSLMILGSFSLCWMPFVGLVIVQVYGPDENRSDLRLISLRSVFTVPALINSTVNPVIYGLRIPVFKEGARRALCCPKKRSGQTVNTVSGRQATTFRSSESLVIPSAALSVTKF